MNDLYEITLASISQLSGSAFMKIDAAVQEGDKSGVFLESDSDYSRAFVHERSLRRYLVDAINSPLRLDEAGTFDRADWSRYTSEIAELEERGWIDADYFDGNASVVIELADEGRKFVPSS